MKNEDVGSKPTRPLIFLSAMKTWPIVKIKYWRNQHGDQRNRDYWDIAGHFDGVADICLSITNGGIKETWYLCFFATKTRDIMNY